MRGIAIAIVLACCGGRAAAQTLQTDSARGCAVCHLRWAPAFSDPDATPLIKRPDHPAVEDSDTCFGCHDGSVGDSRRRVWLEHGHQHDITPPDTMTVPSKLPLDDGNITCLTCHTAHAGRGPETIATAIFLRVANERSELCLSCHADRGGEGQGRHHPLVDMDQPVPDSVGGGLARFGPEGTSVTCQSCHTPHGGRSDYLLVRRPDDDGNCVACHAIATPQIQTTPGAHHPVRAALTPDARDAIADWHPELAGADTLSCRSCHVMHKAKTPNNLLAKPLEDSALCLSCHTPFESVTESPHDLRISAPDELNAARLAPEQSGQCGACHLVHQSARPTEDVTAAAGSAERMNQRCTTCHAEGECGESAGGLTLHHPAGDATDEIGAVHCMRCHNPHDTTHPRFLRAAPDEVCAQCHEEKTERMAGGHAFSSRPDLRNAQDRTAADTGQCGFCHSVHDATGPMLWAATPDAPQSADALCTSCHQPDGLAADRIPAPLRHRREVTKADVSAISLPLFDDSGQRNSDGAIACATCHDPHGDANVSASLLRGKERTICLSCHRPMGAIGDSPHGPQSLASSMQDANINLRGESCGPCHEVHQVGDDPFLWDGPVDASQRLTDASRCYGCHDPSKVQVPRHAPIPIAGMQEELPLVEGSGAPVGTAWISCSTCHLAHGREFVHANGGDAKDTQSASAEIIRAAKPLIRRFQPPNTCSHCHGFEGLIRFLHFHEFGAGTRVLPAP